MKIIKSKNSKKANNNDINFGYEKGYIDPDKEVRNEAIRRIEEAKKPFDFSSLLTKKNILIFIIWVLLYMVFIFIQFGAVYFLITIAVLIFTNLGKRRPGSLSAYSVFNPNNQRILGTLTVEGMQLGVDRGTNDNTYNPLQQINEINNEINKEIIEKHKIMKSETKSEIKKEYLKSVAEQSLNSLCKCGSNKKYKNCCLKKKEN